MPVPCQTAWTPNATYLNLVMWPCCDVCCGLGFLNSFGIVEFMDNLLDIYVASSSRIIVSVLCCRMDKNDAAEVNIITQNMISAANTMETQACTRSPV